MSGKTVSAALDRVIRESAAPCSISVDHGTEFMSRALEDWAYHRGVQLDFIDRANPSRMPSSRPSTGARVTSA
jgi:putative transposase